MVEERVGERREAGVTKSRGGGGGGKNCYGVREKEIVMNVELR